MAQSPRYLERRYQTWYAKKAVPSDLQETLGKAPATPEPEDSEPHRGQAGAPRSPRAHWETLFAAVRSDDPLRREAAVWRPPLQEHEEHEEHDRRLLEQDPDAAKQKELAADYAQETLAKQYSDEKAREWLAESSHASQSVTMHRQAIPSEQTWRGPFAQAGGASPTPIYRVCYSGKPP